MVNKLSPQKLEKEIIEKYPLKPVTKKPAYLRVEKSFIKKIGCLYIENNLEPSKLNKYNERLLTKMKKKKKIKIMDDDVPFEERRGKIGKILLKKLGSKKMIDTKIFNEKDFSIAMRGDCNKYGNEILKDMIKTYYKTYKKLPDFNLFIDRRFEKIIWKHFPIYGKIYKNHANMLLISPKLPDKIKTFIYKGGKKSIRKHKGINQSNGRLKKGFKYSGKKLKSGLPQIIKIKK